jgi:hypothetical protein
LNPRPHEAQLKDQKVKKSSRSSSRRRKKMQGQQKTRKAVNQAKWQRKAKISSKLK